MRHNAGTRDRLLAFFGRQRITGVEPGAQGTNIPGFGQRRAITKTTLTVNETHMFGAGLLNEARFGRTMQDGGTFPATVLNPADFGIADGVNRPLGLPQMVVAGALSFGGPATLPQGRKDTLYVFNDTLTYAAGRHTAKAGGEFRRFLNNNFAEGTGQFNFPSMAAFLSGTGNAFSITLGERRSHITEDALSFFAQDAIRLGPSLTIDLGLRYEWHMTPTERDDQFVVFDAATASLVRVGVDVDRIYRENNDNIEPRLGLAWTVGDDGRTVVRAAFGSAVDQPGTTAVNGTAGNPPFATPLSATGAIPLSAAVSLTQPIGLAPDDRRSGPSECLAALVEREPAASAAGTTSPPPSPISVRGAPICGSRAISTSRSTAFVPIRRCRRRARFAPVHALGTITQVESTGFSRYHALSLTASKRLSRGLLFDTSYTWSKSLDTNSLNSSNFDLQDGYDIPNQYGLSDFDARHRFVLSATYQLPFDGSAWTRDWQIATIVQSQSGNPVNIVTSNATLNGVANTVRPDLVAPIRIIGSVDQWFDPASFAAVPRFGNLGRNVVIGPAFHNTDLSVRKLLTMGRYRLQLRADAFDLFNHPNLGPPGNVVGSPTFGKISRTRLPTGEAGSSRQIQLVAKLSF